MLSPIRLMAIASSAMMFAAVPAHAESITFMQFVQDTNAKLFHIERIAGVTTFTANNVPVDVILQDFAPGTPYLESDVFFSLTASSSADVTQTGDAVQQDGYAGSLSFITGGGVNLLTLAFDDALTASFLGADSGTFSSSVPPANINASSDVFDLSRFVGGNFALGITGLTTNVTIEGDFMADGNVAGTFAGAIPEPASWALMIAGFGMIGLAMRRQRDRSHVIS